MPRLTAKAFERFGFATATLLTDWPGIVGAELARYTAPERLRWPRQDNASESAREGPARQGATLVLRVDAGRAIDVQYRAQQIMERINVHFGYRAVAEIRILQAPIEGALEPAKPRQRAAGQRPSSPPAHALTEATAGLLAGIEDPGLRTALERMRDGLSRRGQAT